MAGTTDNVNGINEWTVMFFFASDNPLSPLLISQLKAIKDAGFQEHTEVLVYFDPQEKGVPTKIYNVNQKRKEYALARAAKEPGYPRSLIGDGNDPYVRHMSEDEIDPKTAPATMRPALDQSGDITAEEALRDFVEFGVTKHRARNYMLILIGHGMIVGNDSFLPDDNPISAITLTQLQAILNKFKDNDKTRLQLLGLHSCSMSSVEVAYQLKGTANYMMATQGTAFVNSWPYRQLLKKTFNTVEKVKTAARDRARLAGASEKQAVNQAQVNVQKLIEKIYFLCLHNSTDFMSAGYSADLVLCSLETDKLAGIKQPLQTLVQKLKDNLFRVSPVKDLILLAHWEAQSFWDENYTDLYDFCRCLSIRCNQRAETLETLRLTNDPLGVVTGLRALAKACDGVTDVLDIAKSADRATRFTKLIIQEDNFGWQYQYSHGLSVYFPWSEPLDDDPLVPVPGDVQDGQPTPEGRGPRVVRNYLGYEFTKDFGEDSWWSFLASYFENTKRQSRIDDEGINMFRELLDEDISEKSMDLDRFTYILNRAENTFNSDGTLNHKTTPELKRTPEVGASCACPSIKNYPTDVNRGVKKFSITPGALRAFRSEDSETEDDDD